MALAGAVARPVGHVSARAAMLRNTVACGPAVRTIVVKVRNDPYKVRTRIMLGCNENYPRYCRDAAERGSAPQHRSGLHPTPACLVRVSGDAAA